MDVMCDMVEKLRARPSVVLGELDLDRLGIIPGRNDFADFFRKARERSAWGKNG